MQDEKLTAKERAGHYRTDESCGEATDSGEPRIRSENEWQDIIDRQIAEAMRQGAFENLPGRGKPLNLNRDSMIPDDQQMAFNLLRNNDLAPSWISERADIQTATDRLYRTMGTTAERYSERFRQAEQEEERLSLQRRWDRQVEQWDTEIQKLNRRILDYNLTRPVSHLEIVQIRIAEALARVGAGKKLAG